MRNKQWLLIGFLGLFMGLYLPPLQAQNKREYKKRVCEHREEYKRDFLKDERSPFYNKEDQLKALRFFKPNRDWRITCRFELTPNEKPFELPTYSGITKPYIKYGLLHFEIDGQSHSLAVYRNMRMVNLPGFNTYLFLPFKDFTNGESTYGGGRYIDLKTTDIKDGQVVIDFNKCYNPWCAYSDGYNCPIPPQENHLAIEVKAGEKVYKK
ncbi:MAG: DUF1684 domain-containing protein [Bacteroidota bacterium]